MPFATKRSSPVRGGSAMTRPRGWWYPWIFVAGMAVVIVVNGIMATFALGTWTGLETEGHYRKGLAYNENLAAARAQEERGWKVEVEVAAGGALNVSFRDNDGVPLEDLAVQVLAVRPTHEGYDVAGDLTHVGEGRYRGRLDLPLSGQWELRVHAFRGKIAYQMSKRIQIP